jgi:hypothetical protein
MVNGAPVMILGEIRQLLVHASLHGPPRREPNCENKGRMTSEASTALILKAQYCNRFFVLIIVKVWLQKTYFNNELIGAFRKIKYFSWQLPYQGCKLLSDIGQCPTKFGKCPSKSNFDRTLVRSQKNLRGILAFYLTLRRNGYTYLSRDLYISCDVYYICPAKFSGVGFCPTKFKLCPAKIGSDRTNVLSSQIFICSPAY